MAKKKLEGRCPTCGKDFAEGVKSAYKLGRLDEEQLSKQIINMLRTGNGYLWEAITNSDKIDPLPNDPHHVTITLRTRQVKRFIKHFKKTNAEHWVRLLEKQLEDRRRNLAQLAEEVSAEKRPG